MNNQLTKNLIEKHNKIFNKEFNFECEDGWHELIDNLCSKIQKLCDNRKSSQIKATKVKEKFGTLRFHIENGSNEIFNLIYETEAKSAKICEITGKAGKTHVKEHFYKTLCPEKAKELGFKPIK